MSVKRSITFDETTSEKLDDLVPKSRRSKFVDRAVNDALKKVAKQKAIDALENAQKISSTGKSVVESLQNIRKTESERLANNRPQE